MLLWREKGVKCQPGGGWEAVKFCRFMYEPDGQKRQRK